MAKNIKRILALCMVLVLSISMIGTPAMAKSTSSSTSKEWYQVIVNGNTVASASGKAGDHTWLVQGVYKWSVSISGTTMNWSAGKHSGSVNLANYITIPEGFEIADGGYTVEHKSVEGTNSQSANFDNAIITVVISALYNPTTQETLPVEPDPTEPPATEPPVTEPPVTEPPVTEPPVTEPPATEPPVTEPPATEPPATEPPVTEPPATEPPVTEPPATEPPVTEPPATEPPVTEPPATEPPATEPPVTEPPATEPPVTEPPATEPPVTEPPVDYEPVVRITKTAAKDTYKEGETISWTITVKNVSAYTAYNVAVSDALTGDNWSIAALAPGASQIFTATLENAPAGTIKNVAVVSWDDNDEIPDEDEPEEKKTDKDDEIVDVDEPVNYTPVLKIVKTADKAIYKEGETITWTITVHNISTYTAYDVVVSDELTGEAWTVAALEPNNAVIFTATLRNAPAGTIKNVAVVSWDDNDEIPNEDEPEEPKTTEDDDVVIVEEPVNYTPVLTILKTANKAVYETGEIINWSITVKNVSEYTAYDVVVTDELTGDRWTIAALAPGAQQNFTTKTLAETVGSVRNVAVVTWEDGDEIPDEEEPNEIKTTSDEELVGVNDPAPENYTPVLQIIKTAEKTTYKEGESVKWFITVKNVSEYTAYDVTVVDRLAKGYWIIDSLAPGAEKTFEAVMENVAAGSIKNVVVATWEDGDDIPDEEEPNEITETSDEEIVVVEEPVDYEPILTVIKTANKSSYKKGDTIKWTIKVKNVSAYTAYNVVINDELTGDTWTIDALEPGAEKTFKATTKNAKAGTIKNVVVVSWEDGDEIPDEEEPTEITETSDDETVKVKDPAIPATPVPPANPDTPDTPDTPNTPEQPADETPAIPATADGELEIPDEEVPLADAPKTGDVSMIWIALSSLSAGGMMVLGKKREDDEE